MRILADASMPLVEKLASLCQAAGYAVEFDTFQGRQPSAAQLAVAEVLLIRSITRVDESFLNQAPQLRWLGTATIGMEHVDTEAVTARGICFHSTPGVNAQAVGDYVASAIAALTDHLGHLPSRSGRKMAAIVGAGHTGRAAGSRLRAFGYHVSYYDPPIAAAFTEHPVPVHADWQRVVDADVISIHVPLIADGPFPTVGLFDETTLASLADDTILINASRGPVVSETGLRAAKAREQQLRVILDVWEYEPNIAADLLPYLTFATPHIAGHSVAGKVGGTLRLFQLFTQWAGWSVALPKLAPLLNEAADVPKPAVIHAEQAPNAVELASWVLSIYDIRADDERLRQAPATASEFDALRRHYPARAELSTLQLQPAAWQLEGNWPQRLRLLKGS
ncbi:4-phosphoerythronate dehydrogenase [Pseudidiomarina aestuarii]|uniref:4-phosphoerythronate dehydrogenase n=1 Tax=Pseudidiomarina aestuarii TaxID=624146 RepID=UPI003A96B8FB